MPIGLSIAVNPLSPKSLCKVLESISMLAAANYDAANAKDQSNIRL